MICVSEDGINSLQVGVSLQDPGETEMKSFIRDQKSVIDLAPQSGDDERDSVIRRLRFAKREKSVVEFSPSRFPRQ